LERLIIYVSYQGRIADNTENYLMKEGKFMPKNNSENPDKSLDSRNNDIDGGPIGDQLNSDNSFSDSGLENARLLQETIKKGNS
jgi:hypothetical protein